MDRALEGQVALVTGATSGIGRACALAVGAAGARVGVNYRSDPDDAAAVVEEIAANGGEVAAVRADVAEEEDVGRMFDEMRARFGTVDILINNAGIQMDAPVADMSLGDWQKVLDVNLTGQFLCARAAIAEFRRRGAIPDVSKATGKIICMSSVHDVIPWSGRVNYAASKGGVDMLMRSLAQEVAAEKIRVNAVAPGAIRTRINREAWEDPAAEAALLEKIPYGRVGEPEDVAKAVVWLASDDSDYVVGATLYIDGGMTLYPGFRSGG